MRGPPSRASGALASWRPTVRRVRPRSRTTEEVRGWLMQRYGDYVSYKPAVSATTWPLFAIPVLLILLAGGILIRRMRGRA